MGAYWCKNIVKSLINDLEKDIVPLPLYTSNISFLFEENIQISLSITFHTFHSHYVSHYLNDSDTIFTGIKRIRGH